MHSHYTTAGVRNSNGPTGIIGCRANWISLWALVHVLPSVYRIFIRNPYRCHVCVYNEICSKKNIYKCIWWKCISHLQNRFWWKHIRILRFVLHGCSLFCFKAILFTQLRHLFQLSPIARKYIYIIYLQVAENRSNSKAIAIWTWHMDMRF